MRIPLTKFAFCEIWKVFACKISAKSNFFLPKTLDLLFYLLCRPDTFKERSPVEIDIISEFSVLKGVEIIKV